MALHADAIAEHRAARVRARRIDRYDADGQSLRANNGREPIDERALSRARRAGDADDVRAPGSRIKRLGERRRGRLIVFHDGDSTRERAPIAPITRFASSSPRSSDFALVALPAACIDAKFLPRAGGACGSFC